jgi:hypothetical protein
MRASSSRATNGGQVVIRAHLEPDDTVGFPVARGSAQDRRRAGLFCAQVPAQHRPSRRKHQIEDDQVNRPRPARHASGGHRRRRSP